MKKMLLVFIAIATLHSCKAQDAEVVPKNDHDDSLNLTIKETTTFKAKNMRFDAVISDSRCPEGVQCIQAGEAKVQVRMLQDGKEVLEELVFGLDGINESNTKLLWVDGTTEIHAVDLTPYPKEGVIITSEDYNLIIRRIAK